MKRVSVFFTLFIIAIIVLADVGRLPPWLKSIYDFPGGDKIGHFILFGLLNFFVASAFIRSLPDRSPRLVALSIWFILAILIGLEEFSQKSFRSRTFDLIDLLASYLGSSMGGLIAFKLKKRRSPLQR